MNIKNLYVVRAENEKWEKYKIERYRNNPYTGHNEILIIIAKEEVWLDAHEVILYRDQGSVFCWKEHGEGDYIELNKTNAVCPDCGWWKCSYCGSCYCNKS